MLPDLDYARLKRSFEYFVEHYAGEAYHVSVECCKPIGVRQILPFESRERALAVSIAGFVEDTQDFCHERVFEIDRDLQNRDAYTLSFLREYFTRPG